MTEIELYNKAKEAYYNGESIMTDYEFDELEERLGLANKSYVGSKHNPSYTIQHPYIMGSLSKIQIKETENWINNNCSQYDWVKYYNEVLKYVDNNNLIITPKYDGCSFEAYFNNGKLTISTRGDGEYGKNIENHIYKLFKPCHYDLRNPETNEAYREYTLRGEVLIDKYLFEKKYSEFVNPRSFVSGVLNRDYDENDERLLEMINDLSIVIYDIRVFENNHWIDKDWFNFKIDYLPTYYKILGPVKLTEQVFEQIYTDFKYYREVECPFALDGIVFKPIEKNRVNNIERARPADCVAIKFAPMLQETEVVDIEWSLAKNGELHPIIITNPVIMDGKIVTRASAHNYGYLEENNLFVGSKVILSLAGDIIPFIYKITHTTSTVDLRIPNSYRVYVDGCHLYKHMTEEEIREHQFIESANTLNIPSIGPAAAKTIYDYMVEHCKGDDFLGEDDKEIPNNILLVSSMDILAALGGKTGNNASKSFVKFIKDISLADVINSCSFNSCGKRVSEEIAKYLTSQPYSFEHLAEKAYSWCMSDTKELAEVKKISLALGREFSDYVVKELSKGPQIPIIMTGEPTTCATKGEFLRLHPEYCNTTSWKEVQIVFTNSLDSTTGKMKKAKEKGIEIRLY